MRPPTALPATHSPSSGDVGTSRIKEQLLVHYTISRASERSLMTAHQGG
jgi:hypothetical protein